MPFQDNTKRTQEDALAFLIFFFLFFLKEMRVNPNGAVKLKKKKIRKLIY
jgi:hypothetical protein